MNDTKIGVAHYCKQQRNCVETLTWRHWRPLHVNLSTTTSVRYASRHLRASHVTFYCHHDYETGTSATTYIKGLYIKTLVAYEVGATTAKCEVLHV